MSTEAHNKSHVRYVKHLRNAMLSTAWAVWHPAVFTFAAKHVMSARCVASCTETRDISSRTSDSARNVRCTNVMSARNPRLAPFLTKCTYTIGDALSEICAARLVRFAPSANYQSLSKTSQRTKDVADHAILNFNVQYVSLFKCDPPFLRPNYTTRHAIAPCAVRHATFAHFAKEP